MGQVLAGLSSGEAAHQLPEGVALEDAVVVRAEDPVDFINAHRCDLVHPWQLDDVENPSGGRSIH